MLATSPRNNFNSIKEGKEEHSASTVLLRIIKQISHSIKHHSDVGSSKYWSILLGMVNSQNQNCVECCQLFNTLGGLLLLKNVLQVNLIKYKYALKISIEILFILANRNVYLRDKIYSMGFINLISAHLEHFKFSDIHISVVKLFSVLTHSKKLKVDFNITNDLKTTDTHSQRDDTEIMKDGDNVDDNDNNNDNNDDNTDNNDDKDKDNLDNISLRKQQNEIVTALLKLLKSQHVQCVRTAVLLGITIWQNDDAVRALFPYGNAASFKL